MYCGCRKPCPPAVFEPYLWLKIHAREMTFMTKSNLTEKYNGFEAPPLIAKIKEAHSGVGSLSLRAFADVDAGEGRGQVMLTREAPQPSDFTE